jgi:HAD-hyrolase-like protein
MGMQAVLTLSGVTRRRDLMNLPAQMQPHWVIEDLRDA